MAYDNFHKCLKASAYDLCMVHSTKIEYGIRDFQSRSVPISVLRISAIVLLVYLLFKLKKVMTKLEDFG